MPRASTSEAEAFAKRAQEIDPNEVAPVILAFKAKTERRCKRDKENRTPPRKRPPRSPSRRSTSPSIADPEVQLNGIKFPKNFKDLTRERLKMNARLELKKNPRTLAIESKLNDPVSVNMDKQPLPGGDRLPPELHRAEHRPRPQGAERREHHLGHAGDPDGQQHPAQDGAEAHAQPAGADLQGRGRGAADHQSAGVGRLDDPARRTTWATW